VPRHLRRWSRGCPVNLLGVGHAARHEAAMRAPLLGGRLHWASTEAAPAFVGYMEGAVRAGEAAAAAVLAAVSPSDVPSEQRPPARAWGWSGSGARDGGATPRALRHRATATRAAGETPSLTQPLARA